MTLLEKLEEAVQNNQINSPFKTQNLKEWICKEKIINDETGQKYTETYIEGFLSSSTVDSTSTKTDKSLEKLGSNPESYKFIKKD